MLLIALHVSAQTENLPLKMTLGSEFEHKKPTRMSQLICDSKGDLYMLRRSRESLLNTKSFIERFDKDMSLVSSDELSIDMGGLTDNNSEVYLYNFFLLNDGIHSLTHSEQGDKEHYFISKLQPNNVLGATQKVAEHEAFPIPAMFKPMLQSALEMLRTLRPDAMSPTRISKNGKRLMFCNMEKADKMMDFSFTVCDEQLAPVWKGGSKLPFRIGKDGTPTEINVDNNGNVYLLLDVENKSRESGKDTKTIQSIYVYQNGKAEPIRFDLQLSGHKITYLRILEGADGNITFAGVYGKTSISPSLGLSSSVQGVVTFKLSLEKNTIIDLKSVGLSANTFSYFRESASDGLKDMLIRKVWVNDAGETIIDMEKFYSKADEQLDPLAMMGQMNGSSGVADNFFSLDILIIKVKKDGTIAYETTIPKGLRSTETMKGLFHTTIEKGNELFVIYNDHPDNFKKVFKDNKKVSVALSPASSKVLADAILATSNIEGVCCKINENGSTEFTRLFKYKDERKYIDCSTYAQFGNKLYMPISKGNKHRMMLLEL